MAHSLTTSSSEQIEAYLCERLVAIRLLANISQAALATKAGVSRRTISRMENGQGVSLDTFIRIMQALDLTDHLASLVPSTEIRPIERVRNAAAKRDRNYQRKRASSASKVKTPKAPWKWGDS